MINYDEKKTVYSACNVAGFLQTSNKVQFQLLTLFCGFKKMLMIYCPRFMISYDQKRHQEKFPDVFCSL